MANLLFKKAFIKSSTQWSNLSGCSKSLILSEFSSNYDGLTVLLCTSTKEAMDYEAELNVFNPELKVFSFPDWETLPYDYFSPHQDIISNRIRTLYNLNKKSSGVIIIPISTFLTKVAPTQYITSKTFIFKLGDTINLIDFKHRLDFSGYRHVKQVIEHGEYSVRGSIIDLFPMASSLPLRLELFDDELESIRTFDPETQITVDKAESIEVLPAKEFPLDDDAIALFRTNMRTLFGDSGRNSVIYDQITKRQVFAGVEYYIPLFFKEMTGLFSYFNQQHQYFITDNVHDAALDYIKQYEHRYDQYKHNQERPLLPPDELLFSFDTIAKETKKAILLTDKQTSAFEFNTQNSLFIASDDRSSIEQFATFIDAFDGRAVVISESEGRQEVLTQKLSDYKISFKRKQNWQDVLQSSNKLSLITGVIDEGCFLEDKNLLIISEFYLTGYKPRQSARKTKRTLDSESIIHNLSDLKEGDAIVHIDHGVGRYQGLNILNINGQDAEFVTLIYQDDDKLYVPVGYLHLIARYSGASHETAPINRLGTDKWSKAKSKAAKKVRDVAAELLLIYAKREAAIGYSVDINNDNYLRFSNEFPFEETEDQLTAIKQIEADMAIKKPMDRLVCGDVGFGKTEVAMRAAFLAIDGGKQAAVLVPTTLLAQQHYQNFLDRFAHWPFNIVGLTRFTKTKELAEIEAGLKNGTIDMVIGTHKLLSKSIKYHNLGLVIIDEEHRFGVRHKEHMKSMRSSVDVLTLTATPIPRTLNMSLAGMRDLSIITTPPAERLAIKTLVSEWNDELIVEACQRELARGGQVYFLHNEVKTIERITHNLEALLPQAKIRYAHGQMQERTLENVMVDFYHQRFNILVATTIIESGIDIPTANTIIINRADKLGLAQLHQIRGRVGRSHHRAYAFLLTPPPSILTKDAKKRLNAIESMEDLGVGFTLATHDMEIRGAGEFLGDDQSGQIQQIGFTLYSELLERAVKALKEGKTFDVDDAMKNPVEIELHVSALIPSTYIFDVQTRLIFYKRIASSENVEQLNQLQIELIDRFGLLPDELKNLIQQTELKLIAEPMGIEKIDLNEKGGKFVFSNKPNINTTELILMIQKTPNIYRLDGQQILRCTTKIDQEHQRFEYARFLMERLSK